MRRVASNKTGIRQDASEASSHGYYTRSKTKSNSEVLTLPTGKISTFSSGGSIYKDTNDNNDGYERLVESVIISRHSEDESSDEDTSSVRGRSVERDTEVNAVRADSVERDFEAYTARVKSIERNSEIYTVRSRSVERHDLEFLSSDRATVSKENIPYKTLIYLIGVLFCIFVFIHIYAFPYKSTTDSESKKLLSEHENILKVDVKNLKTQFPSQNLDIWPEIFAGIKKVRSSEPPAPSVFVLLHADQAGRETCECLTKKICPVASKFLMAKDNCITLSGNELARKYYSDDYGRLIADYHTPVNYSRVLIVNGLELLNGRVAQAFHYFCDEITPLIPKAVYFFTLKVPIINSALQPVELAEKTLHSLWKNDIPDEILKPLITRMTSSVIIVSPERNLSEC